MNRPRAGHRPALGAHFLGETSEDGLASYTGSGTRLFRPKYSVAPGGKNWGPRRDAFIAVASPFALDSCSARFGRASTYSFPERHGGRSCHSA
jgi:hypothetical protein